MIYSGSLERNFATKNIYIKNMTSWAKEAASLSGGKRAPHALEGVSSLWTGSKATAYFGRGRRVKGWLVSVPALFSLCCKFLWLWLKHVKQRRY